MIPGLIYIPNFCSVAEQSILINEIDALPWCHDLKRRVQHYGYKYDYTKKLIDPTMAVGLLPANCLILAEKISEHRKNKVIFDQLIVNEYMPGQGIAAHIDCMPCFANEIATISLCDVYPIVFNLNDEKHELFLEVGSLLLISGEARYVWRHSIPARKSDNGRARSRRVSLTFRNVILVNA